MVFSYGMRVMWIIKILVMLLKRERIVCRLPGLTMILALMNEELALASRSN